MGKLILQEFVSLDGFCADRNKTTGYLDGTYFVQSDEAITYQGELGKSIDLILLGSNTYKMFAEYWPTAEDDSAVTKMMNTIPKKVFSKTLKEVSWGKHGNISLVKDDTVEYIRELKDNSDQTMIVWGSLTLAQALLKANLFDEIMLSHIPIVIGEGFRLFPKEFEAVPLEVIELKEFEGGIQMGTYRLKESIEVKKTV